MQIVTGYEGTPHVTAWQDRDLNQGIFGDGTYILNVGSKMVATIVSNNEIRIADGAVVMQGCMGVIQKGTYDTIAIANGSQGLARHDLICAQYSKNGSTGVESMSLVVIKGTAASSAVDPSYTSGDIQNGDTLVQVPLYRVVLSGLTVSQVVPLVDTAPNITSINENMWANIEQYSGTQSVPTAKYQSVKSLSLEAGVYYIQGLAISSEITNYMKAKFNGAYVYGLPTEERQGYGQIGVFISGLVYATQSTGLSFEIYQNSGHAEYVDWAIDVFRIR